MKYLIPFTYLFDTRQRDIIHKISFLLVCYLPSLLFIYFQTAIEINILVTYTIGFISVYCIYEIGYLFNDIITIKFENNPTIRWNNDKLKIIEKYLPLIVLSKVSLLLFFTAFVYHSCNYSNFAIYCICLGILALFFGLHNVCRCRFNILTMFIIVSMRYLTLPVLILEKISIKDFLFLIFLIPVCRTIEYASKEKYRLFNKYWNNEMKIRFYYYIFLLLIISILFVFKYMDLYAIIMTVFFVLLRTFNYFYK